jgi:hypothetical protein
MSESEFIDDVYVVYRPCPCAEEGKRRKKVRVSFEGVGWHEICVTCGRKAMNACGIWHQELNPPGRQKGVIAHAKALLAAAKKEQAKRK